MSILLNKRFAFCFLFALCILVLFISFQFTQTIIKENEYTKRNARELKLREQCVYPKDDGRLNKKILFLKTHKTGSSTFTNILNRYADVNNISVLLPSNYHFDWPFEFKLSSAEPNICPMMLVNHARYTRNVMHYVFPPKSTYYISLLRDPITTWVSTFNYFHFEHPNRLNIDNVNPMGYFLEHLPSPLKMRKLQENKLLRLVQNPMFHDFGLDKNDQKNDYMINRAIKVLDNDFQLMLILEHFDESLILLRRRFCWTLDDVIYFKVNSRIKNKKQEKLNEQQKIKLRQWNNADTKLYNFFIKKFWKQVEKEGPSFFEEVEKLKELNRYYIKICTEKEAYVRQYEGRYSWGYQIRPNLTGALLVKCQGLLRNEVDYVDFFRKKQNIQMPKENNFL